MEVDSYYDYKKVVMDVVFILQQCLSECFELLVVEGVGSFVEINLCENDIVNMGYVEVVDCLVIIIVDIDKGGVFVYLIGILVLLFDLE